MLLESIRMSWSNIIHNKMRSFLTVLGIVIGVASIIALISIVQGASSNITSQISGLGADRIMVQVVGTPLKQGLSSQDLTSLSAIANTTGVSPTVSGTADLVSDGQVKSGATVEGHNDVYFRHETDIVQNGRGINAVDVADHSRVAVIGSDIAASLFYGADPVGRTLLVGGTSYTVVGLLKSDTGYSQTSTNDTVIIPYTSAMRTLSQWNITSLSLYVKDTTRSDAVVTAAKSVLDAAFNYHDDTYQIFNMQDMITTLKSVTGMLSLMLAGIASISLIVGGIGIMNMMLVSVTERTAEIGLRKALGAEPRSIQLQFLIESVVISLAGGLIGMVLGLLISAVAAAAIGFPFVFSVSTVFLAVGFSTAIGIVFGLAPARKASRLNPIDALRSV